MKTVENIACEFPATLEEALAIQSDPEQRGRPLAGGTDLMVQWESGVLEMPERAVSVMGIPELKQIRESGDCVVVGAAVTHAELRRSPIVRNHLPALAAAAATVGGAQIQTLGTIAGNCANASPAGDLPPALFVTDGTVVVASTAGEREIPLTKFFLDYRKIDLKPEELIVRFVLPKLPDGFCEGFRKLGQRSAQAISKVMGSYRACVEGGTVKNIAVAIGSVAATVVRLPEVESWLAGRKLDKETFAEAEKRTSAAVKPIDDIRSTAEYRKWVSGRIVRGFLEGLARS